MRTCGECNICCDIAEVAEGEFYKPAGHLCKYSTLENGCELFHESSRPNVCHSYQCAWLRGHGKEIDRPDNSGIMVSISAFNGGTWIFVQEIFKDAFKTSGKNILIDVINRVKLPAIIVDYDTKIGKDYGDYVAIHKKLENRASNIKGKHLFDFNKDIKIYELKHG